MTGKRFALLLAVALLVLAVMSCSTPQERLTVATTTSLYDTGLWGYLEPLFEEEYGVELHIIYAGTGKALEWGMRGDVDVVAIHDPGREQEFVDQGYGLGRHCIAYNYFLIVGPADDPAGIAGMSPQSAFNRLLEVGQASPAEVKFVSRGDDSGTHAKEKQVWRSAGYDYEEVRLSGAWYVEAGTGMGPTLVMADQKDAYTLSDIGTFLAFQGDLGLLPVVEEGDILLNVYSAIAVNPEAFSHVKVERACQLINFLTSAEVQALIGDYGVEEYGRQLFAPCIGGVCEEFGCPPCRE